MQEYLLTAQNLPGFSHLIPSEYCDEIRNDSIYGVGVADGEEGVAVFLCREEDELLQILWLYVDPDHRGRGIGPWLLERRLKDARFAGTLRGAVADLPEDDPDGILEDLMMRAGFSVTLEDSGVYTLSLESLETSKLQPLLLRKVPQDVVVPLGKASQGLRRDAVRAVKNGTLAAPLPQPLDWEQYDPVLSALYYSNGQVQGILLIARLGNSLSLDFAWASASHALHPLLSHAIQCAWETLPRTTNIIIPTANEDSVSMVEQSLDILPRPVLRARLSFPAPLTEEPMILTDSDLRSLDPLAMLVAPDAFSGMNLAARKGEV